MCRVDFEELKYRSYSISKKQLRKRQQISGKRRAMSSIYDGWERLVAAVLDREELRRLAFLSSRETSFSSSISSAFDISPYDSRFITLLDDVPGSLTGQMMKAARNATMFQQECAKLKSKTEQITGLLRQAERVSNDLYNRPTHRIISNTELMLEKALKLVMKCSGPEIKRVFDIIPAGAFQNMSSLLENSIKDISWLIAISDYETLRYPPITINEPIISLIWKQITTLYKGSVDNRSDAAASLASLARGSDQHGKLIVEEGGVDPLLKLVEEGNLEGQENAIRAIVWLAKNPYNGQHMIDAGAPQLLVKMLKEGPVKVQADVAWAVSELAMHYPKCQNIFAQHDIVAVLVGHLAFETVHEAVTSNKAREMENPIIKVHMKEMAARALWQLAKGNSTICISITESCAIPCFAALFEERVLSLLYYSSMVLLEIIAMAEKNPQLRRLVFDPNSLNCKALVSQLHSVLRMVGDSELLISCIKIVGYFDATLEETQTSMMMIPLLKLMNLSDIKVSGEACIVLTKLCSANYPTQNHCKQITDAGGVRSILHQVYFGGDNVQPYALFLLCYITINMPDSEQVAQEILNVLKRASVQPSLSKVAALDKLLPEAIHKLEISREHKITNHIDIST